MATASTSKKIQRVQQSGVTRRAGQRRPLGFGALVAAIIVLGLLGVWLARESRLNVNGDQPRAGRDKWYEAWGTFNCDSYLGNIAPPKDTSNISTLGNGLISVAPTTDEFAGDNATLDHFFESVGMKVSDSQVTMPDGTELKEGTSCGLGKKKTSKTELKLFIWPPQASDKTKPEIVTEDFGSVRIEQDKGIYALALVPAGTDEIDLPNTAGQLSDPEGNIPATTVAPDATTTTAPGETTTAPAETTPPTTAPGTTAAPTTAAPTTTAKK